MLFEEKNSVYEPQSILNERDHKSNHDETENEDDCESDGPEEEIRQICDWSKTSKNLWLRTVKL